MSNWWLLLLVAMTSIWISAGLGIAVGGSIAGRGLNYRVSAMWRRSVSCVCAGALMATAWDFFVVCAATGWHPHKVVAASAITLGITGWIWLWDEVSAP